MSDLVNIKFEIDTSNSFANCEKLSRTMQSLNNTVAQTITGMNNTSKAMNIPNIELLNQKSFDLARGFSNIGSNSKSTASDLESLRTNINILNNYVKASEGNLNNLTSEYTKLSQKSGVSSDELEKHRKKIINATNSHNDMSTRLDTLNRKLKEGTKNLNGLSTGADKNATSFKGMATKIAGYVGAAVGINEVINVGKKSIEVNSNMIETQNKFNIVYGEHSKAANEWAKNYTKTLGVSELKTKEAMGDIQNLFTGFGMDRKTSMNLSKDIIMLANDLDSFNNLSSRGIDVQKTMQSALMGESEAAKTLGASILEPQMNLASMELGFGKYSNKMDETTKIMIRMKAIQMQSKDAMGDMVRSQDSETAKRRRLNSEIENSYNLLGQKLMPLQLKFLDTGISTIQFLNNNFDSIMLVVQGMSVLGSSFGIYKAGALFMKGYEKATLAISAAKSGQGIITTALTAVQTKFNLAMAANPVGMVLGGLTALVGIGYLVYKNWDMLKTGALNLWTAMDSNPFGKVAKFALEYLNPIGLLTKGVMKLYEWYQKFKGEKDITKEANITQNVDGSHKSGLSYVPHDGYVAELHKGERVLTASENKNFNNTNTINNNQINNTASKGNITVKIEKIIENLHIDNSKEGTDYKAIAKKVVEHIIPQLQIALAEV